jgi:hypothetical protein
MLVFIIQWKVTLPSGKLAMARRDSLQDFETTPRPLLFACSTSPLPTQGNHNINPTLYGIQRD